MVRSSNRSHFAGGRDRGLALCTSRKAIVKKAGSPPPQMRGGTALRSTECGPEPVIPVHGRSLRRDKTTPGRERAMQTLLARIGSKFGQGSLEFRAADGRVWILGQSEPRALIRL